MPDLAEPLSSLGGPHASISCALLTYVGIAQPTVLALLRLDLAQESDDKVSVDTRASRNALNLI